MLGVAMVLQLWAAGGATVLADPRPLRPHRARLHLRRARRARRLPRRLRLGRGALARLVDAGDGDRHRRDHARRASAPAARTAPRRRPCRARSRGLARPVGLILGSTLIYLAFNALFVVSLAFAGNYDPGDATVLSYAYLFASYLVAATGFALGMSRIADMRARRPGRLARGDRRHRPGGLPLLDDARRRPAMAVLISGGAQLIGEVLPKSFDATGRPARRSSPPSSAPGWSPRCWSTCCCRRCSRSAARASSTGWRRSSSSPTSR